MMRAYTVMRSDKPILQAGKDQMDDRQMLLCNCGASALCDRLVAIAKAFKVGVADLAPSERSKS